MPRDPWVSEWANPTGAISRRPAAEHIGGGGATRGTETSKYPEEEKSNEIPRVVASERGRGQTGALATAAGVVGPPNMAVRKARGSGTAWEGRRDRVTAPYAKPRALPGGSRVPPDT